MSVDGPDHEDVARYFAPPMEQLFISHVEEDEAVAADIAGELEKAGYTTWYYERDSVPGPPYLDQASGAIERAAAFVLLISRESVGSNQVTAEVIRAFESRKPFVPLRLGITQKEFQQQNRTWQMALGAATTIAIPASGPAGIVDRLLAGLKQLAIAPSQPSRPQPKQTDASEEVVTCTVFAPTESRAGAGVLVQVWLHKAEQAEEVGRRSEEFDPDVRRRVSAAIAPGVTRGTVITIDMQVGELAVRALSTRVAWQGDASATLFRLQAPIDLEPSTHICRADFYVAGLPIGLVNFKLRFVAAEPGPAEIVPALPAFHNAYLCYASADRDEVLRRAQILSTFDIRAWTDVELQSGMDWEEQLHRAIDEADVFFLFWSHAAQRSQAVESEWRYALTRKGDRFIRPIAVETPIPPPPPELAHLHFNASFANMIQG